MMVSDSLGNFIFDFFLNKSFIIIKVAIEIKSKFARSATDKGVLLAVINKLYNSTTGCASCSMVLERLENW